MSDQPGCLLFRGNVCPNRPIRTQGPHWYVLLIDEVVFEEEPFLLVPTQVANSLPSEPRCILPIQCSLSKSQFARDQTQDLTVARELSVKSNWHAFSNVT